MALAGGAFAQAEWAPPSRFTKPDLASDEGGLWAIMDREETRLRRSPFRMRDEALNKYLQDVVCRLAGDHCPDVRVYAVRTPFFNASMAPNGMMQVWSGLLLRMDNEAQLAAVLGHEIGHFLQRHSVERLRDMEARTAFGQFIGMFGVVGLVGQLATLAGAMAYSRDHEREADRIGLTLMRRAGYDPREAGKVWGNLLDELRATPDNDRRRTACCSRRTRRPTSGATRWARSRPDNPATPALRRFAIASRRCAATCSTTRSSARVPRRRWCCSIGCWHRSPRSLICCTHGAKPGASAMRSATRPRARRLHGRGPHGS